MIGVKNLNSTLTKVFFNIPERRRSSVDGTDVNLSDSIKEQSVTQDGQTVTSTSLQRETQYTFKSSSSQSTARELFFNQSGGLRDSGRGPPPPIPARSDKTQLSPKSPTGPEFPQESEPGPALPAKVGPGWMRVVPPLPPKRSEFTRLSKSEKISSGHESPNAPPKRS